MKYPKNLAILAGLLVVGTSAAYLRLGGISSSAEVLRDAPADELNGEVKATVESLKGAASAQQGSVPGQAISGVPAGAMRFKAVWKSAGKPGPSDGDKKYRCQDDAGQGGYNKITVGELLATKQGECSVLINAVNRDGLTLVNNVKQESLKGADLKGANLRGAALFNLIMTDVQLQGADLTSADLSKSFLEGASLEGATLENIDAYGAVFRGANLDKANMRLAFLSYANFEVSSLKHADLTSSVLSKATFFGADLYHLVAKGVSADSVNLSGTKMDKANFSDALLRDSNLDGANMRGADLSGVLLDGAHYSITTQFPALFNPLRKKAMRND